MCDMTHVCVCDMILWLLQVLHDSSVHHDWITAIMHTHRGPLLDLHTWHDMLRHDSCIYMCHDSCIYMCHDLCTRAGVFSFISIQDVTCCIMTHIHMCHYVCTHAGSTPIPIRDVPCCSMTHSYMWHESCTRAGVVSLIPIHRTWYVAPWLIRICMCHYTCTIRRGLLLNSHTGRDMLHHDSFIRVWLRMHTRRGLPLDSHTGRDMLHYDSFVYVTILHHDSFIYVTWHMHTRRDLHPETHTWHIAPFDNHIAPWDLHVCHATDAHSTWCMHMRSSLRIARDMSHHETFIRVMWLMHTRHVACTRAVNYALRLARDMSHHETFICVIWLMHTRHVACTRAVACT